MAPNKSSSNRQEGSNMYCGNKPLSAYKVVIQNRSKRNGFNKTFVAHNITKTLGNADRLELKRINRHQMIGYCGSAETANKLVSNTNLKTSLNIFIPFLYNHRFGVIKDIDLSFTEEEILECIIVPSHFNTSVLKVKRMNFKGKPSSNVLVCFDGNIKPDYCSLWNLKIIVEDYSPRVRICNSCFRFGHTVKFCVSKVEKCNVCSRPNSHHHVCGNNICPNCQEEHSPYSIKQCRKLADNKKIVNLMHSSGLTFWEASQEFFNGSTKYTSGSPSYASRVKQSGNKLPSNTSRYVLQSQDLFNDSDITESCHNSDHNNSVNVVGNGDSNSHASTPVSSNIGDNVDNILSQNTPVETDRFGKDSHNLFDVRDGSNTSGISIIDVDIDTNNVTNEHPISVVEKDSISQNGDNNFNDQDLDTNSVLLTPSSDTNKEKEKMNAGSPSSDTNKKEEKKMNSGSPSPDTNKKKEKKKVNSGSPPDTNKKKEKNKNRKQTLIPRVDLSPNSADASVSQSDHRYSKGYFMRNKK
uniref:Nucleic-acid-binding protein from mobile element jockey n=1 Tax=Cacopsylla melanoneura TaxID=428564 RepID=A0A8D9AXG3_9HEMI